MFSLVNAIFSLPYTPRDGVLFLINPNSNKDCIFIQIAVQKCQTTPYDNK